MWQFCPIDLQKLIEVEKDVPSQGDMVIWTCRLAETERTGELGVGEATERDEL